MHEIAEKVFEAAKKAAMKRFEETLEGGFPLEAIGPGVLADILRDGFEDALQEILGD